MDWLRKWYRGEFKAYENEPYSRVFIVGFDVKRHWTSHLAHVLLDFWMREWKWAIGTGIAVAGLLIAYQRLG